MLMTSAEVIIIGGGLNGASAAFNLARLGVKRVTRLERRHLGAGATGKSGALVRMHYTNEAKSGLAWESLKVFRNFTNVVGGDCGFEATGFVQIVGPAHAPALAANVAMQQRLGIDTRLVSRDELLLISPDLRVDDIGAAARGHDRHGLRNAPHRHRRRPRGGSRDLARPHRRACGRGGSGRLGRAPARPARARLRPRTVPHPGPHLPLARRLRASPPGGHRLDAQRLDSSRGARVHAHRHRAGRRACRPDGRPIIDQIPSVPGLFVMLGESGTSFKTPPAIGRCLAEWIVKSKPWIDSTDYGIEKPAISR